MANKILDYSGAWRDFALLMLIHLSRFKDKQNSSTTNSTTSTSSATSIEYKDTILLYGDDADRIKRLTDDKNHYYSYLYALYLKQLESAWNKGRI